MSGKSGCLKNGCFGCLGLFALTIIFLGISVLVAKNNLKSVEMEDRWLAVTESETESPAVNSLKGGRVILNLSQGEFEIKPAAPGEPLTVKAKYDVNSDYIKENYTVLPDSTWVYQLDFHRTTDGLQSLLQAILGQGNDAKIVVYLPTDVPLDLEFDVEKGGMESEFGGLWLNDADISVGKGGFVLSVQEPLQHPMGNLKIHGSMGGVVLSRLGNASPQSFDLNWKMGGGDMDLRGQWANDCDFMLKAHMGGMDVRVPEDVRVTGLPDLAGPRLEQYQELPQYELRFNVDVSMGGFEARR